MGVGGGEWGRERGRTNERPGADHVISGPMRGLEKNCTRWHKHTNRQTSGHGDSMTESAQCSGADSVKIKDKFVILIR